MGFEAFLDCTHLLFCLCGTLRSSWLGLWSNNTIYIFLFTVMCVVGIHIWSLWKPTAKGSVGTRWHLSVFHQIPKWQSVVMSWKGEREPPKDPADSLNLRKSGNWVIKQTRQVGGMWSLLHGTDTVAPPGKRGTPVRCFPTRGILRRYGNWQESGW